MKTKVLLTLNIILGIMAALFSGCHSPKRVTCKYGVPQEVLERREKARLDSIAAEHARLEAAKATQQDSVKEEDLPPVPDIPVCKYGAPGGDW